MAGLATCVDATIQIECLGVGELSSAPAGDKLLWKSMQVLQTEAEALGPGCLSHLGIVC